MTQNNIYSEIFRNAYINPLTGWHLDAPISFNFWFNVYAKGRKNLEEIVAIILDNCHVRKTDFDGTYEWRCWAHDVKIAIESCIVNYLQYLDDYDGNIEECDLNLSAQIVSDSLITRGDAYNVAELYRQHTKDMQLLAEAEERKIMAMCKN